MVRALASHQCGLGSIPRLGVICGLSLLVLYIVLRGLTPVFLSPKNLHLIKSGLCNFQFAVSPISVPLTLGRFAGKRRQICFIKETNF